jgi:hypothetical protein
MAGGFQLSRTSSQGDVTGKEFQYVVPDAHGTLIAPGDVATIIAAGATAAGLPQADTNTTLNNGTLAVTGIVFAINPTFEGEALSETGLPVGTGGSILVNVDPHALYEVDVSGTPVAIADVGLNFDFAPTTATKTGGLTISNMTILGGSGAVTAGTPFKVVSILPSTSTPPVFGDRVLARMNESTVTSGGVGK